MQRLLLLLTGATDEPQKALSGDTPLGSARTPALDRCARESWTGWVQWFPAGAAVGSDIAALLALGYDPLRDYTGRGPLEARGVGAIPEEDEVLMRADLVHLTEETFLDGRPRHVALSETRALCEYLDHQLGTSARHLFPLLSGYGWITWRGGPQDLYTVPPQEAQGRPLAEVMPQGNESERLETLIYDSMELLERHPLNRRRRDLQLPTLDALWPWGVGRAPRLESFFVRHERIASLVSTTPAVRGLGLYAGLSVPRFRVAEPVSYQRLTATTLDWWGRTHLLIVHTRLADEMGHRQDPIAKQRALERWERDLFTPLWEAVRQQAGARLLLVAPYATLCANGRHAALPAPFLLWGRPGARSPAERFQEEAVGEGGVRLESAGELVDRWVGASER